MEQFLYHYKANVLSVRDGDTFVVDVDLGFQAWLHGKAVRVVGCDAFELRKTGGDAAKNFTEDVLAQAGNKVILQFCSRFEDNFGRLLARVWVGNKDLAELLKDHGHAVEFTPGNKKEVPPT